MSPLAKVFVVLNCIVMLLVFGMTATIYQVQKDWREIAETQASELAKLEQDTKDLLGVRDSEISTLNGNISTQAAVLSGKEATLDEKMSEVSNLKNSVATKTSEITQHNETIKKLFEQATQKDAHLAEMTATKDAALAAQKIAEEKATAAQGLMAKAILDRQQSEEVNGNLLVELNDVKELADSYKLTLDTFASVGITTASVGIAGAMVPAIDGMVAKVEEDLQLLILSVGENNEVKLGYEFSIYRGDTFVGKAEVVRVAPSLCGAKIKYTSEGQSIRIGDKASTRLSY